MFRWGPIGEQVFNRTYARTKDDGSKETFDEVVERIVRGNSSLVEGATDGFEEQALVEYLTEGKIAPAGRHWWVSGVPGRQFLFNCHVAGWTDQLADHVEFVFNELMKGGGVGSNYSSDLVSRMHRVRRRVDVVPCIDRRHPDAAEVIAYATQMRADPSDTSVVVVIVPDTREGWVSALGQLCRLSQLEGRDLQLYVNLSDVRASGTPIRGFGGTASGPGALAKMLMSVAAILNGRVGEKLTGMDCMELDHAIAECVVAGNVRRSARMSIMHWRDPMIEEFIKCKTVEGQHWSTNISVEIDTEFWNHAMHSRDCRGREILEMIVDGMLTRSEPGIFNSDLASVGERAWIRCTNPCGEIALEPWENCNLGHVNLAEINNDRELFAALELVTRWLIRATFSDGMDFKQSEIVARNRRIGVGFLGLQEWAYKRFGKRYSEIADTPEIAVAFSNMYKHVREVAHTYCNYLGINAPVKVTTVAPTGTVAKMYGATEGMHAVYARYFIRRVRYASNDPEIAKAREEGLHVEPDNNVPGTLIVSYPCRDSALDIVPADFLQEQGEVPIYDALNVQSIVQSYWSDNAVSFTLNVPADTDREELLAGLIAHGPRLKGTTVMVEGSYEQAPIERITEDEYVALGGTMSGSSTDDCANGACPVK